MDAVTTRAVGHDFRSHFRRQAVIAVFVTADAIAGDTKLLCQGYSLVALCTTVRRYCRRRRRGARIVRHGDVVNAVAIGANRRARDAADDGLAVNTLKELGRFGLMTLATGRGDIDFGN